MSVGIRGDFRLRLSQRSRSEVASEAGLIQFEGNLPDWSSEALLTNITIKRLLSVFVTPRNKLYSPGVVQRYVGAGYRKYGIVTLRPRTESRFMSGHTQPCDREEH